MLQIGQNIVKNVTPLIASDAPLPNIRSMSDNMFEIRGNQKTIVIEERKQEVIHPDTTTIRFHSRVRLPDYKAEIILSGTVDKLLI